VLAVRHSLSALCVTAVSVAVFPASRDKVAENRQQINRCILLQIVEVQHRVCAKISFLVWKCNKLNSE
jgi:hypothetical protein